MPDGSAHKFSVIDQLKVDEWRALSDMPADVVRNIVAEGVSGIALGAETSAFKALEGFEASVIDIKASSATMANELAVVTGKENQGVRDGSTQLGPDKINVDNPNQIVFERTDLLTVEAEESAVHY